MTSLERKFSKDEKSKKCYHLKNAVLPTGSMYFQIENITGETSHSLWQQKIIVLIDQGSVLYRNCVKRKQFLTYKHKRWFG